MSQERELEAAKRKILALSEKTIEQGCTEAEFYSATQMIATLLDRFNLSMTEVMVRQQACIRQVFDTKSKHRSVSFSTSQAVARFCQVRVWQTRSRADGVGIQLTFFGLEPDVKMACYLSELIKEAATTAVAKFKETPEYLRSASRRNLTFSFYNGMAHRISERLDEMNAERLKTEKRSAEYHAEQLKERMIGMSDEAAAEAAKQTTGTALISLEKLAFVEEELKKHGPKLYKVQNYSRSNSSVGKLAGREAGDKVNLQRPLANQGYGSTLLLK